MLDKTAPQLSILCMCICMANLVNSLCIIVVLTYKNIMKLKRSKNMGNVFFLYLFNEHILNNDNGVTLSVVVNTSNES